MLSKRFNIRDQRHAMHIINTTEEMAEKNNLDVEIIVRDKNNKIIDIITMNYSGDKNES